LESAIFERLFMHLK